jgi:chromosome segregation ATPase
MNRRREHIREQATNTALTDSRDNLLNYPGGTAASSRYEASGALDLVSQAAEMIRGMQDRALESESRSRTLAESAIEKVQAAEARIRSAEAARGLAQETVSKLIARLQEAEHELTRTQSRITTAETQVANAEQRIRVAEARAINAEKAVIQIEDAIRTQLIGVQRTPTRGLARAA